MPTNYASSITFVPKTVQNHYQTWYNTENLKKSSAKATCGVRGSDSTVIGGRNGTWPIPSPLTLTGFNFDLPNGTKVEKVIVHYAQQKISLSSSQALATFPAFSGAKFTLLGTGKSLTGVAAPTKYTHSTLTFEGITPEQINNQNFGLKIEYPKNSTTNTGLLSIGDVSIEVVVTVPRLTVSASTPTDKLIKGSLFEVEFSVTRLESINVNPVCEIRYDEGLSYQSKTNGVGTITESGNNVYTWNSNFTIGNTNKIKLKFKADTEGIKRITIYDTITNKEYTLTLTVVNYTTTVTTTLNTRNAPLQVNQEVDYQIVVKTTNPDLTSQPLSIELPLGTTITNLKSLKTSNGATTTTNDDKVILTLNAPILNGQSTVPISAKFAQSGYLTQTIFIGKVSVNQTTFIVQSSNYGRLGFSRIRLPEEITENMGDKIEYVLCTVARYVQKGSDKIVDYVNNLRVGVYNNDEQFVNNEDSFVKLVEWNDTISTKNFALYTNRFVYDENNPVFLVYSHDYTGDPVRENLNFDFTEPILMEYEEFKTLENYTDFPKPIKNLLGDGDYASCTIQPLTSTAPVLLYEFNSGGVFDLEDFICQGITINGNYVTSGDVELRLEVNVDGKLGYRNIILQAGSGDFNLGNKYDLFGFRPHDLRNRMSFMDLRLTLFNPYSDEILVELNDINLTISYFYAATGGYGFEIDGERSEEYGIYFTNFDYDAGTENNLMLYQVPGTDDTIPYRMNVTSKEIKLDIALDDCDIKETAYLVDKVVKLFTNIRSKLTNKPEPKSIIFDIMPDRRFWWIREKSIESEWGAGTYDGTITLVIPSGTAQSLTKTITGSSGANNGIVAVTPIIKAVVKEAEDIQITERYRDQSVVIRNDGTIGIGDIIIIDNEQPHKITLQKQNTNVETDITHLADYSTTWFSLHKEYYLESDNCIITSVEFYEEW